MSATGKRILKILGWVVGIVVAVLLLLVVLYVQMQWDAKDDRTAPSLTAPTDSAAIARGEYLFKFQAQCWGCHQSPATDANSPPAGGRLFDLTDAGPGFGKWYSSNLTPDPETGLGGWTDGEIVQALREGVRRDRTSLFPLMPVDWYQGMSDDDALALVAYLRSLPPVKNPVPRNDPSFMAKALFTFGLMKPRDPITERILTPPRTDTVAYGRYISSNLADCAGCHTPRNLQDGSFYLDSLFAGSSFPYEGEYLSFAPNITPDVETGIGAWSEEQFVTAVTAGVRPDGTVLTPHMPYAYYKSWSADDLHAVFEYLKTVPPIKRTVPPTTLAPSFKTALGMEQGKMLFRARCEVWHGENGTGAQTTNVKLAEVAASLNDDELKEFIATGQMDLKMPAYGKTLSGEDMDNLVAFIRTWPDGSKPE
jgi:mono/diheme cytochrome c family protein